MTMAGAHFRGGSLSSASWKASLPWTTFSWMATWGVVVVLVGGGYPGHGAAKRRVRETGLVERTNLFGTFAFFMRG